MNFVISLICSATLVAPAVRAAEVFCAVDCDEAGGLVERRRVWPRATLGAIRTATSKAMAMRFNMFLLFELSGVSDCRMTRKEYKVVA